MKHRTCWWTVAAATVALAAPLAAQGTMKPVAKPAAPAAAAPAPPPAAPADTSGVVRPGMTEAQVVAVWGQPVAVRRMNDWTFLFFRNGNEREVGYYDTVFLQNDQVVDAIVRSPDHVYAGQSSSPPGRVPEYTPPDSTPAAAPGSAVTGVQVKPGR
jgi:hypothetical protein